MKSIDDALQELVNSGELNIKDYIKQLGHSNSRNDTAFLGKKAIELLKNDILQKNNQNKDNLTDQEKIDRITEIHLEFSSLLINTSSVNEKLRLFISSSKDIKSFSSKCSRIKKFINTSDKKDIKEINSIHSMAHSLSIAMSKRKVKSIRHYDIFNYLIKKDVCNKFKITKVRKIEGDYLLFRRSERSANSINISHFNLRYDSMNDVFTFKSSRKGFKENNVEEVEEIKTDGIFFQNTATTYVFLCKSKASGKFSFIETITTLTSRMRNENRYILGLFNGEVISSDDYDNRPFSSKALFINISNNQDLLKNLRRLDLLRDHSLQEFEDISLQIDDKNKYIEEKKWENTLNEINSITNLGFILKKISNSIDDDRGVFILKK